MAKPADDLEAVRVIVEALEGFETEDKERIVRWTLEKLKLPNVRPLQEQPSAPAGSVSPPATVPPPSTTPKNLKTFVEEKQPKSDVQFAATVAFFQRFEAPPEQRKENINADDLKEACRLVNRERLKDSLQTLNNACNMGLLDRVARGLFTINSVGENLVAMTLPAAPGKTAKVRSKKLKGATPAKKKNRK